MINLRELNIGKCIIHKRKEKGITQEQLANYIGVSKASVSKWESGSSYPDILLLPEIATYFNISVDELLGYSPQLTKEDIKNFINAVVENPAFEPLREDERYNLLVKKFKEKLGEKNECNKYRES